MTRLKLTDREVIVTAYAEDAAGPGWANLPIWIIIKGDDGIRVECLQPDEQTREMLILYDTSQAVHLAMKHAVTRALQPERCQK